MMNITDKILAVILSHCNPQKVILYGEKHSVCGHQLTAADFCIILEDSFSDKRGLLRSLYLAVDAPIPVNFLMYTEDEWSSLTSDYTSFASSIKKKGTVLYEKTI